MLLCFGFVTKTVLVTHQRFSCACATSGVSLFTPVHPFFFCRCSQDSWLRGCSIPSDTMFISKSLRKVGERGWYLWQWHLSSWVTLRHAFWDMAEHHLPGQWEVVNEFKVNELKFVPHFACACSSFFSYQTVAICIHESSHLPTEAGSEWVAMWLCSCWSGWAHLSRVLQNLVENSECRGLEFLESHSILG